MQIFEEKKCILKAEMLKKKSFSSRITYSVKDVSKRLRVYTLHNSKKAVTAD